MLLRLERKAWATFDVIIIIVIVVFQNDIRRALGRIGQGVMPFGRNKESTGILDAVSAAVDYMVAAAR